MHSKKTCTPPVYTRSVHRAQIVPCLPAVPPSLLSQHSASWRHCGRACARKAFEKKTPGKEVGMGERAIIIAVTAVVLILLLVLYIFFMR